jgi:PleD family two-component response regulator
MQSTKSPKWRELLRKVNSISNSNKIFTASWVSGHRLLRRCGNRLDESSIVSRDAAPAPRKNPSDHPDMDLLIVDDASAIRRIVRGLLKDLDFKKLRDAEKGQLALDELKKSKSDFVVSDWNMPVLPGSSC